MLSASSAKNWKVFAAFFVVTGALSAIWIGRHDFSDEILLPPLRHTAQLAFALYILILVARPLQQILREQWTAKLLRNRRSMGVALTAVMTAHLGLIAYRFGSQPELTYPLLNLIVGGVAYALLYLMFITSFDGPTKALGPKRWKLLHRTGLIWAGVIFGLPRNLEHALTWDYWKFGIWFVLAILIRITAWQLSRRRDNQRSPA